MAASLPTPLCPEWTARGYGTVMITKHYKPDGRTVDHITVDRADPEILIDDQLLCDLSRDVEEPVSVGDYSKNELVGLPLEPSDHEPDAPCECPTAMGHDCLIGWFLHIDGRDRHVVYQIGEQMPHPDCEPGCGCGPWPARWPD